MTHRDTAALEAGFAAIRDAPLDRGVVELVVARPSPGERVLLAVGELDEESGLVGDCWLQRGTSSGDGANRKAQLTLMNARVAELIAGSRERWALAGDQLYVDLHLGPENLPSGTRLEVGTAVVEVTDEPHTGCRKFLDRFGADALRFVNSAAGREVSARGVNTRIVRNGTVRPGDAIRKL